MSEINEKNNAYDKLTPQRKALVDMVLKNLERQRLMGARLGGYGSPRVRRNGQAVSRHK